MAPPKKPIDLDHIERLAAILCTLEEISAVTGVSIRTLQRRCDAVIKRGRADGRMSVRRKQFEIMRNGSAAMAIWLGKQLLGQSEKFVHEQRDPTAGMSPQQKLSAAQQLVKMLEKEVERSEPRTIQSPPQSGSVTLHTTSGYIGPALSGTEAIHPGQSQTQSALVHT